MATNIPIKSSQAEAMSIIASKLKGKDLSFGERRKLQDQYESYATGYSKGGVVKKKTKAKKNGTRK